MFIKAFVFFATIIVVAQSISSNISEMVVPSCAVTMSPLNGESVQERILSQINLIKKEVNQRKYMLDSSVKAHSLSQFLSGTKK